VCCDRSFFLPAACPAVLPAGRPRGREAFERGARTQGLGGTGRGQATFFSLPSWKCAHARLARQIFIWNYQTKALVKSFEASPLPVRCGAFIARKSWIVAGCDDMHLRVYNYNTLDKVHAWEAHQDYIRSVAVHPTQPFLLSSSDDMLIKLWDWEKGWQCTRVFEGHSHYVMQICFNPKDPNVFASASLDRSIKVRCCWLLVFCCL
jgi:WD40 repeat protein